MKGKLVLLLLLGLLTGCNPYQETDRLRSVCKARYGEGSGITAIYHTQLCVDPEGNLKAFPRN